MLRGRGLAGAGLRVAVPCPWRGRALSGETEEPSVHGCLHASSLLLGRFASEKGDPAPPGAPELSRERVADGGCGPGFVGGACRTRSFRRKCARQRVDGHKRQGGVEASREAGGAAHGHTSPCRCPGCCSRWWHACKMCACVRHGARGRWASVRCTCRVAHVGACWSGGGSRAPATWA